MVAPRLDVPAKKCGPRSIHVPLKTLRWYFDNYYCVILSCVSISQQWTAIKPTLHQYVHMRQWSPRSSAGILYWQYQTYNCHWPSPSQISSQQDLRHSTHPPPQYAQWQVAAGPYTHNETAPSKKCHPQCAWTLLRDYSQQKRYSPRVHVKLCS